MTTSPEFVSPINSPKPPSKIISARTKRRRRKTTYTFSQPKSRERQGRKTNQKYKFLCPWPPEVEKMLTQKNRSFDELAKSKKCLVTADFLNLFETYLDL